MEQYKTIYIADKNAELLLNELIHYGWRLHSKQVVDFKDQKGIIGTFDEDENKLNELTLFFKNDTANADYLLAISEQCIKAIDKKLKASDISLKGPITGIVFASIIMSILILFMCFPEFNFVGAGIILIVIFCLPAYPLCIAKIIVSKKNALIDTEKSTNEINELREKAIKYNVVK